MQILYKGKSSTYVGECVCGTVKCPICGDIITVFQDGTGMAKGVRKAYQDKQKEANQRGAAAFLAGLEETQEKDTKIKLYQLKQILEDYAGIIHKEARLLIDIYLNDGESMRAGEVVSLLKDYGDGFHAEHNDFACKVSYDEVELIN